MSLFHLAYHVTDLKAARTFYSGVLGCKEGRSSNTWVDYDFFGHQISLHLGEPFKTALTGQVGGKLVPMPHMGVILDQSEWNALATRLQDAGVTFILEPHTRFKGKAGEQSTMFFCDPSGNPIEVKGFKNMEGVFAG